ncbi:MAG: DNA repair exonuclease [Oscillospiraceae bacterium]|nr:DNA repair exonuclease [Oscillospiraceae bacterium]
MRFIHCSDIHLDSKMESNFPPDKARQRRQELLDRFEAMADYARHEGVAAVLIAGDLFDTPLPSRRTVSRLQVIFEKYSDLDFLYLKGNHDLDYDYADFPDNFRIFPDDGSWGYFEYVDVTVAASVSANSPGLSLDADRINIVMLHGQEVSSPKNDAQMIALPDYTGKKIDYLALGHIHSYKQQRLDERGVYCYSGCLEGRGFDECGDKGFVLLETGTDGISSRFITWSLRRVFDIDADISDANTAYELEGKLVSLLDSVREKDMVRITLTGTYGRDTYKDLDHLEALLRDRVWFAALRDESRIRVDPAEYMGDISLKGEFIRLVMASDMSESDKSAIISCGLKALAGEDVDI